MLREKGTPFAELGLSDPSLSDDGLVDAIEAHPVLLNRPRAVTPKACACADRPRRCLIYFPRRDASVSRTRGSLALRSK